MHKQFLQSKEKLLEGEKERTLKLTAFQTKAILIGKFYRQQPVKRCFFFFLLLLALGTLVRQGTGCTVALQTSAAWELLLTESIKARVLKTFCLGAARSAGEREVTVSLSICGEKLLWFRSYS